MVIILNPDHPKAEDYRMKALEYNENVSESLLSLCEPFFNLGFTAFEYTHFFKNATCLYLSTHKEWGKYYIENYADGVFIKNHINDIFKNGTKYYYWNINSNFPKEKEKAQFFSSRCKFDLWNNYTKYIHHETSIESWSFSMSKDDNKLINFFLNYPHRLEQFIISFRSQAFKMIDVSILDRTLDTGGNLFTTYNMPLSGLEKELQKLDEQIPKIDKFPLYTPNGIAYLSSREIWVLCCLSNGTQLKAVGGIISATDNAVERCWESIKNKTQCTDKTKIIKMYRNSMLESLCGHSN